MRRVVVTGMGLVTPLSVGVERTWRRLLEGASGVRSIDDIDVSDLPVKIAGRVPRGKEPGCFDAEAQWSGIERKRLGDFILFALAATREAVEAAGWMPRDEASLDRTGVVLGSGAGGLPVIADGVRTLEAHGPRRVSPFVIPGYLINEASGLVSIRYGFRGPNHAVVTACATGSHAIGDAARMIALDDADVMIAGGTEAPMDRMTLAGFAAMRALSTHFNHAPEQASRPWDRDRDGFVLGEGAGVVVLEELEHARRRGATIHAEVLGYGMSGDAHHMTAPAPDGSGAIRAMRAALRRARLGPDRIDYLNAHATSTQIGDPIEITAVREVFGASARDVSISSTKSSTGHLLGAAGAVEAIISILALRDQIAPATLNLHDPGDVELDLVPHRPRPRRIRNVLSNSFAFGGANAALVFGAPP